MGGDKIVEFITIIIFEILIWKGILGPWLKSLTSFWTFLGKIYLKSFISIFSTNSLLYSYAFNSFLVKKGNDGLYFKAYSFLNSDEWLHRN